MLYIINFNDLLLKNIDIQTVYPHLISNVQNV